MRNDFFHADAQKELVGVDVFLDGERFVLRDGE